MTPCFFLRADRVDLLYFFCFVGLPGPPAFIRFAKRYGRALDFVLTAA